MRNFIYNLNISWMIGFSSSTTKYGNATVASACGMLNILQASSLRLQICRFEFSFNVHMSCPIKCFVPYSVLIKGFFVHSVFECNQ